MQVSHLLQHRLFLPLLALALVLLANVVFSPEFFHLEFKDGRLYGSLVDVLNRSAPTALLAIGMALVISTGGIDLSVGSVAALTGAVAASIWVAASGSVLFLAVPLAVALAVGLANGLLITLIGLQPFVATLILMTVARGAGLVYTNGQPVYAAYPEAFLFLSRGDVFGLPVPALIFLLITLITWYMLKWRVLGRAVYAGGANETAARLSGVRTMFCKM